MTSRGNKHYVVCIDGYTKYTVIFPLPNLEAATIWQAFHDKFVCRLGCPVTLHTDKHASLNEGTAKALFEYLNIHKTTTVAHRPESDGQAERQIRSTLDLIAKILDEQGHGEWDSILPKVELLLNTTPSTSTGFTPHFLEFKTEAVLPLEITTGKLPDRLDVGTQVRELREKHLAIAKVVRSNLGQAQRRQKVNYDLRVKGEQIKEGDKVFFRSYPLNPGEIKSFRMAYNEPQFTVLKRLSDVNYLISDGKSTKVVHFNQLRLVKTINGDEDEDDTDSQTDSPRRSQRSRRPPARLFDYQRESENPKID